MPLSADLSKSFFFFFFFFLTIQKEETQSHRQKWGFEDNSEISFFLSLKNHVVISN